MPNPDEPVVLNRGLWDAVAEGLVVSEDLSPSLRLRESFSATLPTRLRSAPLQPLRVPARDWRVESARLRAGTPFGRQRTLVPSGPSSPGSSCSDTRSGSDDKENVELGILRGELATVEKAAASERTAAARRERALFKVVEGLVEYQRACPQR